MEVMQGLLLFTEELACGEGLVIDTPNILASKLALDHMILFSSQFQIICQAVIIVPVARDHHVIGLHEKACSHAITPLIHQQPQHRLSGCNFQRIQPLISMKSHDAIRGQRNCKGFTSDTHSSPGTYDDNVLSVRSSS